MDCTAWITLSAVIVALCIGVTAIIHTEKIQKREQKRRLLNEIAERAKKVISWRSENRAILTEMAHIEEGKVRQSLRLMHAHIGEMQNFFIAITGLNAYISKVSLIFQQGLPEVTQKLINDLGVLTDFLGAWQKRLFTDIDRGLVDIDITVESKKADELSGQVEKSASAVLEKVADIQAKEIY